MNVLRLRASKRIMRTVLFAGIVAALVAVGAPRAAATNQSTVSGNNTSACALDWSAETWMDLDGVPGYDQDRSGGAVDYSNGGYIKEVSPTFNDPGLMEIQHWISGNTMFWRIPLASDARITNGTLTVTLPAGFTYSAGNTGYDYIMDSRTPAAWKTRWATTQNFSTPTVNGNVVTVPVNMPSGSHYVGLQIAATAPSGTDMHQTFKATAKLTGLLTEGNGCDPTEPAKPQVPTEKPCQQVLAGRTLRTLDSTDITDREKEGNGGETNADGWGTYYFRLYGATDNDLTSVTYTATASQGFTFTAGSVGAVISGTATGMGALYGNGYTVAATGIGTPQISADGKTVTLTIDSMPAKSGFAFTVRATPDGSQKQMVIDHSLIGDLAGCSTPGQPASRVATTQDVDCTDGIVTVTTTTTYIAWVWDADAGKFVEGATISVDRTITTRAATAEEKGTCKATSSPTSSTSATAATASPTSPTTTTSTPTSSSTAKSKSGDDLAETGSSVSAALVAAGIVLTAAGAAALRRRRR